MLLNPLSSSSEMANNNNQDQEEGLDLRCSKNLRTENIAAFLAEEEFDPEMMEEK